MIIPKPNPTPEEEAAFTRSARREVEIQATEALLAADVERLAATGLSTPEIAAEIGKTRKGVDHFIGVGYDGAEKVTLNCVCVPVKGRKLWIDVPVKEL